MCAPCGLFGRVLAMETSFEQGSWLPNHLEGSGKLEEIDRAAGASLSNRGDRRLEGLEPIRALARCPSVLC